ncbi:pyridoxamine 5'-phosphate oxidase family protein [Hahella sp. CCB-MM4]|uniref:pyridoxamine 5'-phosphate oxidase family protein n=1 Tax=Hahella sp. (strain CCB-MM4) TaxID=1926491 RepID=UPI000B9B1F5F|nr:pyridoxamine 5'-phosphate oxidase family protein [Hahella sp. CCB-MM4]
MKIKNHWMKVKAVLERGQASSIYCSIASINPDGTPTITPIGTVFLREDNTGYYFDHYTSALARNLDHNPNVCVMSVDSGFWFWFRSFLKGRFLAPPGVRLYGKASPLRPATEEEIAKIEKRVRPTKWLKGSRLLWTNFTHVRDITFTEYRPVTYPVMMDGLWDESET